MMSPVRNARRITKYTARNVMFGVLGFLARDGLFAARWKAQRATRSRMPGAQRDALFTTGGLPLYCGGIHWVSVDGAICSLINQMTQCDISP
jgi:hypothetical protein